MPVSGRINFYFDGLVKNFGTADCILLAALKSLEPLTNVVVEGYDSTSETNL